MNLKLAIAAVFAVTCLAAGAPGADAKPERSARTRAAAPAKKAVKKAEKKKVRNFDFLADEIDGAKIAPDGTTLWGRDAASHSNLIRLRPHFVAEIVKTSEDL